MKKNFLFLASIVMFACAIPSCRKKKGCTDSYALNRNYEALVNDGSCRYSNVTFYASTGFSNGIPVTKINITVNGIGIGTISGTYYPAEPGDCAALGTVPYQFLNGNPVDWYTTVYLASGATLVGYGELFPSPYFDCIKINVSK